VPRKCAAVGRKIEISCPSHPIFFLADEADVGLSVVDVGAWCALGDRSWGEVRSGTERRQSVAVTYSVQLSASPGVRVLRYDDRL